VGTFGRPTLSLCHTGEISFIIAIINVTSALLVNHEQMMYCSYSNAMFFTVSSFSLASKV
jgi:hypothetical protein